MYRIQPQAGFSDPFEGYCDQEYEGGGWKQYEAGFGDLRGEFWLGLKKIHELTNVKPHELHIMLEDFDGKIVTALYDRFIVGGPATSYVLSSLGNYTGTAGDSLRKHEGMKFSAFDNDNDKGSHNCAEVYKGAWWYNDCFQSHLNGQYLKGSLTGKNYAMSWDSFRVRLLVDGIARTSNGQKPDFMANLNENGIPNWSVCILPVRCKDILHGQAAFLGLSFGATARSLQGNYRANDDHHRKQTRAHESPPDFNNEANFPRFAEPIPNTTVTIGRDALLACVVENLKGYKVAWVRVDTQTILSIHHNVITQNPRISLTYNDHRSWYLHIREVEENDRGWYMCQVNTDPMRSRKGYLQVVVPPAIVESLTSNDMVVREGTNVTLTCKAKGFPEPYVMWRREDGDEMAIGGENVNVVDGEVLHITKVSRLHMAAYLCVASNGVPPSISKRVQLRVQFPPMLSIPNQLEGAYLGQDVILECHTEAYPASINYWTTERGDMIISDTSRTGDKFETMSRNTGYTKFMQLKIRSVGPADFGSYRCVAKNSLGETDGLIKLDEIPAPTTILTTESLYNNRSKGRKTNKKLDPLMVGDYGVEEWKENGASIRHSPGAFHNGSGAAGRGPFSLTSSVRLLLSNLAALLALLGRINR
ncbi:uncharacterized protein LOC128741031 [Sabethes cyaneus]|uniref:uncharacterized protein LOC128741031 n=1 Tax=Sabethes cyaneus TaxID=53552 RepID=UPI00237EB33A|nr:uncharacterized protein LOC128741031 [Sabethes cyaneus]